MKKLLVALLLIFNVSFAEFQVEVPIEHSGYYCSGGILESKFYLLTQIMYDIEPMSLKRDVEGHCPYIYNEIVETAILQTIIDPTLKSYTLTLVNENLTYYVRVRSCACWPYRQADLSIADECWFDSGDGWVPFTYTALYESIDYDLSRIPEKLNCSNWRIEIPYRAEKLPKTEE